MKAIDEKGNNMSEDINLCELLKGHEGETFYSSLLGEVTLLDIRAENNPIVIGNKYGITYCLRSDGKFTESGESLIFPSKDQRDWDKWVEEQKLKTWNALVEQGRAKMFIASNLTTLGIKVEESPIEKSAIALLKIHQLIEVGYGGNITDEEWADDNLIKYTIKCRNNKISSNNTFEFKDVLAFHTEAQRDEFLSYPENLELLKDYYNV